MKSIVLIAAIWQMVSVSASCDSDDYYRVRDVMEEAIDYSKEALGWTTVKALNMTTLMNCVENKVNLPTYGYAVNKATVHLNLSEEITTGEFYKALMDCDDESYAGIYRSDYLVFSSNMKWTFNPLSQSDNDVFSVVSNVLPDKTSKALSLLSRVVGKRATNIQAEFDAGTRQQSVACASYAYACLNKCSNANGIAMSTSISGIIQMAAWSHHYCQYKSQDNQSSRLSVRSKNTRYYIQGGSDFRIYSAAMNNDYMGNDWGSSKNQNWCGDHY